MKKIILVVLAVLFVACACSESSYDEIDVINAEEKGYEEGYNEGYDKGYDEGYDSGRTEGKEIALEEYETKYELRREYNSYRDALVYFEFPEQFELTHCDPDNKGEETYLKAIIEKGGVNNESEEFIAFLAQDLMAFEDLSDEERAGFNMDEEDYIEFVGESEEDVLCYEYKIINGTYWIILYYDEDNDKAVDSTKYETIKDGVLYFFMYFPDVKHIPNKDIMEDILESFEFPKVNAVKEFYE